MELQFQKRPYACLRPVVWETVSDEQTQEVKLPPSMPDIGKVLGAWGQPLVRSKEWRNSTMGASGGVMAWVLYAPEDGTPPRVLETWVPFQLHWDLPPLERDGLMRISCLLGGIDARSVSAKKLMLRCTVSAVGEALEPGQLELYSPDTVPNDIHLRKENHTVRIPTEAGEKTFALDEELILGTEGNGRLVRYVLQPEIQEKKILGDKLVFRGSVRVMGACQTEDGILTEFVQDIPFSQYAELERSYEPTAEGDVIPLLTNMEVEPGENGALRLKAGAVGQYVVYDTAVLEVVADAYSPGRDVNLHRQMLEVPAVTQCGREEIHAEATFDMEKGCKAELYFLAEHPAVRDEPNGARLDLSGSFQLLLRDDDGALQGNAARWECTLPIVAPASAMIHAHTLVPGTAQLGPDGIARGIAQVEIAAVGTVRIPAVTGMELGEQKAPDPGRPSLIFRTAGNNSLWDMAKQYGTTVEAIAQANALEGEPDSAAMLLIPVP